MRIKRNEIGFPPEKIMIDNFRIDIYEDDNPPLQATYVPLDFGETESQYQDGEKFFLRYWVCDENLVTHFFYKRKIFHGVSISSLYRMHLAFSETSDDLVLFSEKGETITVVTYCDKKNDKLFIESLIQDNVLSKKFNELIGN